MSRGVKSRPPKRRCPVCGGDHYAWQEGTPCRRCRAEVLEERTGLADVLREQRLARRARLGL